MSSNTKIIVLRSKEILYGLIIAVVSMLIIVLAVSIFGDSGKNDAEQTAPGEQTTEESESESDDSSDESSLPSDSLSGKAEDISASAPVYVPGVYSGILSLGADTLELKITLDKDHINDITLQQLDEAVETMYPLVRPAFDELAAQVIDKQGVENVTYDAQNRYTSLLILQAIYSTLDKAAAIETE